MIDRFLMLGRHTIVYGLGGAALQFVGLLTVPIFTRIFSSSQYGVLETTIALYAALLVLADLGLTSSAQRSYFDYDEAHEPQRRSSLSTGLASSMVLALIWAALAFGFATSISSWQYGTDHYASLIRIAAISIPVAILCNFLRETVRLKIRPWAYTISMTGGAVVGTGFALIDVLVLGGGIASLLWGMLVGNLFSALVSLGVLRGAVIGRFSAPELRRMLAYGLPLIPTSIALWGVSLIDRSLLTKIGAGDEHARQAVTGEYAVANRFGAILMFCVTAFALAYGPFQLSLWQEDPELEKRLRARIMPYLSIGLVGIAVVFSLFAREIAHLVSPQYSTAYQAVGLLTMSVAVFRGLEPGARRDQPHSPHGLHRDLHRRGAGPQRGPQPAPDPALGDDGCGLRDARRLRCAGGALLLALADPLPDAVHAPQDADRLRGRRARDVGRLIRFEALGVAIAVKLATLAAFAASLVVLRVLDHDDLAGLRVLLAHVFRRGHTPEPGSEVAVADAADEPRLEVPAGQVRG